MKPGLYANIHKKQERIKREKAEGEKVEKMRKPGSKGAPTAKAFKESAKTAKKWLELNWYYLRKSHAIEKRYFQKNDV